MIDPPGNWDDVGATRDAMLALRFLVDDDEYGNEDIAAGSVRVVHQLYDAYGIGNACSAKLSVELYDARPIQPGIRTCRLECRRESADGAEKTDWAPLGVFYLNSAERDNDGKTKLVMYDGMALCDQPYFKAGAASEGDPWPKPASEVVAQVCARARMEYPADDGLFAGIEVSDPGAGTCRDVLRHIAAAAGGNWTVTKENRLRFVPLASITQGAPVATVTASRLFETSMATRVTGVSLNDGVELHEAGTDDLVLLEADCPFATDATALAVFARTGSCRYQGFRASGAHVSPLFELGDLVQVDGAGSRMLLDSVSVTYGQITYGEASSPLRDEAEQRIRFKDPAERKASAIQRQVAQNAADVQDVKATEQQLNEAVVRIDGAMAAATTKVDSVADDVEAFKANVNTTVESMHETVEDDSQWISRFTNTYLNDLQPDTKLVTSSELSQAAEELRSVINSHYVDDSGNVFQKRRVFIAKPEPPYDVGDLWVNAQKADTLTLWGNLASTTWGEAKEKYTWGNVNLPHEGIYVCINDKAEGTAYDNADWREADNYVHDSDLSLVEGKLNDKLTDYTSKSEFYQSNEEMRLSVNDALAEANLYTDNGIAAEVVARNAAIEVKADSITQTVSRDYMKVSAYSSEITKYAEKSSLKAYADAIEATVAGTEEVSNPYSGKKMSNQLAAGIQVTKNSVTSLAAGNSTYTAPDGTTKTNAIASMIQQTRTSITSLVTGGSTYTAPDGTVRTNPLAPKSMVTQTNNSILSLVQGNANYTAPDGTTKANPLATKSMVTQLDSEWSAEISALDSDVAGLKSGYATCSTAGATQEKVVTIANFSKYTGKRVTVLFTYANTASSPKLKVQDATGSVVASGNIVVNNAYMGADHYWDAMGVMSFVWTGSVWRAVDSTALSKIQVLKDSISLSVTGKLGGTASIRLSAGGSTKSGTVDLSGVRSAWKDDSTDITVTSGKVTFNNNTFVVNATNFSVTANGTVAAKAGTIGGWTIGASSLYNGKASLLSSTAGAYLGTDGIALGSTFKVTRAGTLTSTSGTIGGWTIGASSLYNDVVTLANSGLAMKRTGTQVGKIGTNNFTGNTGAKGLVFDLESAGYYMAWASKHLSTDDTYAVRLMYANKTFTAGGRTYQADTIYAESKMQVDGGIHLASDVTADVGGTAYAGASATNGITVTQGYKNNSSDLKRIKLRFARGIYIGYTDVQE